MAVIDGPIYRTSELASGTAIAPLVLSLGLACWMARAIRKPVATVTVVDDDAPVRWVTVECLQESGHFVAEADDGRAALEILERGDPCDLVVIDQPMPGLLGTETVRKARINRPGLKSIIRYRLCREIRVGGGHRPADHEAVWAPALTAALQNILQQAAPKGVGNVVPLARRPNTG